MIANLLASSPITAFVSNQAIVAQFLRIVAKPVAQVKGYLSEIAGMKISISYLFNGLFDIHFCPSVKVCSTVSLTGFHPALEFLFKTSRKFIHVFLFSQVEQFRIFN